MDKIGIIGCGNMAEAIIKGLISSGLYKPDRIMASDVRDERLRYIAEEYHIKTTARNEELVAHAKVLLICVKPQNVKAMLQGIRGKTQDNSIIISIAAGITTDYLSQSLSNCQIIRAMPNTPAMVDEGATAIYSANGSDAAVELALQLFSAVGRAVVVNQEHLIDAVTAISGSGPAYFYVLMEEMVKAAVEMGIPVDSAEELVYQTAKGAGVLAKQAYARGESPAELRRKVTSPGGTTEAAIDAFNKLGLGKVLFAGFERARQRSIELSQEAQ